MPKTVTLRLDDDNYSLLKEAAAAQRRSLASFIEYAAVRHLEESAFLEPTEEAERLLRSRPLGQPVNRYPAPLTETIHRG